MYKQRKGGGTHGMDENTTKADVLEATGRALLHLNGRKSTSQEKILLMCRRFNGPNILQEKKEDSYPRTNCVGSTRR